MKARKVRARKVKVQLSPIGNLIRAKQDQLRAAKRGLPVEQQRAIDLKIEALDKHYTQLQKLCKVDPWNALGDVYSYEKASKRKGQ